MVLSLLAHGVVLTAIGVVTPKPAFRDSPEPPTLTVQLLPRIARIRTHVPSTGAASPARTAASASPMPSPLHPHIAPPNPTAPATLQALPNAGTTPGGRIGVGDAPAPLPFEDGHHGVHAMLRDIVGCSNEEATHLTAAEREACNARFAREGRKATPFVGIDSDKRTRFDEQVAADERKRGVREGAQPVMIVPCTGNGSNFGTGCLPDSAIMHMKAH